MGIQANFWCRWTLGSSARFQIKSKQYVILQLLDLYFCVLFVLPPLSYNSKHPSPIVFQVFCFSSNKLFCPLLSILSLDQALFAFFPEAQHPS